MLSTLRTSAFRQLPVLRACALALPRARTLSVLVRANSSLRVFSTEVPSGTKRGFVNVWILIDLSTFSFNCRREGHVRAECTEPTICVACGLEGHQRKDCPNPDSARLEALKTAPIQCFRCGEEHAVKNCPQPAKCFTCGSTEHIRSKCPQSVKAEQAPAPAPKVEEAAAAA
ncbi:hypothetical protein C8F04DRAFT_1188708 [Mycena alexandri]|uniref:CCHC-type domain-containing protein n=1 Tax=Mycena alexandri TaxID=1745969 RepID=A0AAD6SJE5_9AGAR|nr:hypothetical protein C8F04DRAFT_1188708 [Mycena alexandri]